MRREKKLLLSVFPFITLQFLIFTSEMILKELLASGSANLGEYSTDDSRQHSLSLRQIIAQQTVNATPYTTELWIHAGGAKHKRRVRDAKGYSSFSSAQQSHKCIDNSIVYGMTFTIRCIAQLFGVSLNFSEFQLHALTEF